jgi:hypothetical protein
MWDPTPYPYASVWVKEQEKKHITAISHFSFLKDDYSMSWLCA